MITYLNPDAIQDRSIEPIKLNSAIIEITYAKLKALRDNAQLIPGHQYRITDYVTSTTQENTISANHQFDIIVTADSENTLNEVARATPHEGDTYFANSNLNAWEIWYCLDNDAERFVWADTENGKGVIYRMIDERRNDCPYDFKNIMSKHYSDATTYPDYYYTFTTLISGVVSDHSLNNSTNCYNNVIKEYIKYVGVIEYTRKYSNSLNRNLFINRSITSDCNNNSLGDGCYWNDFGDSCNDNSFGNNCYLNSFGNSCYHNSFGNDCHSNNFGNVFSYNSFGNDCNHISFRINADKDGDLLDHCKYNTFDDGCSKIIIYTTLTTDNIYNLLQNIKVDKSVSPPGNGWAYYNITKLSSITPIFVSKEYNTTTEFANIPIGLYSTSTAINNKVYAANVTVTPSKSCINADGGFYETSDERLKNFSDDVTIDLEKLSSLRKKYFTWKDGHGDKQLGVSAQEVQVLYPELVNEGDDGNLSVDYAKLSVVALSAVDKLYNKQKYLEDKLAKIEKALNL